MKKIQIEENFKENLLNEFKQFLEKTKCTDSSITFTSALNNSIVPTKEERPTLYISALAYLKMMCYVRDTDTEIAWHGTVQRNIKANWYYIKDVFLYPQKITSVTVDTDQEKYQEWLQNIEDDEIFNNIRFQGHSHVNMGTTPSSTDLTMYNDFLQVLSKSDYYVFAIMNKAGSFTCFIYDLQKNRMYETADIDVKIITDTSEDLLKNIKDEKTKYLETKTWSYDTSSYKVFNKSYPLTEDELDYYEQQFYKDRLHNDVYTETDRVYDDIDSKFKNAKLITNKKTKIKGAKK